MLCKSGCWFKTCCDASKQAKTISLNWKKLVDMFLAAHALINTAPKVAEGKCEQQQNSQASEACDALAKPVPNHLMHHLKDQN